MTEPPRPYPAGTDGTAPAAEVLAILQDLLALTRRLARLVQEHAPAAWPAGESPLVRELPGLLRERQECLERLAAAIAAARAAATAEERQRVTALVREIQGLEHQAMVRLRSLQSRAAAELRRLPAARASVRGYAGRDPRQYTLDFSQKW